MRKAKNGVYVRYTIVASLLIFNANLACASDLPVGSFYGQTILDFWTLSTNGDCKIDLDANQVATTSFSGETAFNLMPVSQGVFYGLMQPLQSYEGFANDSHLVISLNGDGTIESFFVEEQIEEVSAEYRTTHTCAIHLKN